MKKHAPVFMKQQGMTLVEVLTTISILSFVLIGILTVYDTSVKNIRTDESMFDILQDANSIMACLEDDIRLANEFLRNYHTNESQIVLAAFKMKKGKAAEAERVMVYALDAKHPNRLMRSVYTGEKVTSREISRFVQQLEIFPLDNRLFKVSLIVEDEVAGKLNSLQASSVFTMR